MRIETLKMITVDINVHAYEGKIPGARSIHRLITDCDYRWTFEG
jgi:hypothetical protein